MAKKVSKKALSILDGVKGKRARIVIDHILKHGSITTQELKETYGYDHPPRAVRDVVDQGIPIVKASVTKADGRRMTEYRLGDLDQIVAGRASGRTNFPKQFKQELLQAHGNACAICGLVLDARYLQIDHRVPYLVAGDGVALELEVEAYMLLCGSCNRAKSWSCEHCTNGFGAKASKVCQSCYWASPMSYSHVATRDVRRLDVTWTGEEVADYDAAQDEAARREQAMPDFVKDAMRRSMSNDQQIDKPQA